MNPRLIAFDIGFDGAMAFGALEFDVGASDRERSGFGVFKFFNLPAALTVTGGALAVLKFLTQVFSVNIVVTTQTLVLLEA